MKLNDRERGLILLIVPALLMALILRFTMFSDSSSSSAEATGADSVQLAQQRAARLRQLKALVPAREEVMKQAAADLAVRRDDEHTLLATDSIPHLAQAFRFDSRGRTGYLWLQGALHAAAPHEATK